MARARTIASITSAVSLLALAPLLNWWLLVLVPLSALNLQTVDRRMRRRRKPEYQAAASVLISQCMIAFAAAITGAATSPLLVAIAVPTAFAATRFRAAVVWLAAAVALVLMLAVAFAVDPSTALMHPAGLIVAASVTLALTAATQALNDAELHHRAAAILDPLTGLLNRQGLERRFHELAEQARQTGAPISLLVCDLDRFKAINDRHGHAAGDVVLRDVAYALRKQLRSFELIYRIGGEEFLVVLPGAGPDDASALGLRLCQATRDCHPQGLTPTLSVGVSTHWGAGARFETLFDAADEALYRAKAAGRDRVCASSPAAAADRLPGAGLEPAPASAPA